MGGQAPNIGNHVQLAGNALTGQRCARQRAFSASNRSGKQTNPDALDRAGGPRTELSESLPEIPTTVTSCVPSQSLQQSPQAYYGFRKRTPHIAARMAPVAPQIW
jgi:hypothetical protein